MIFAGILRVHGVRRWRADAVSEWNSFQPGLPRLRLVV